MNLTPWKSTNALPFARTRIEDDLNAFQREMNSLMNGFLTRRDTALPSVFDFGAYPAVDVTEKDNEYLLDADVPGLNEADIDIDFHNNVLTLKGEKKIEKETKDIDAVRVERSYGSFCRDIMFDEEIDKESIKANLKNGVLHIELAKKEKGRTSHKKIPIRT